ncbi:MAG: hypothetical protein AAGA93_28225, partial [Actinomycetota bacterium]
MTIETIIDRTTANTATIDDPAAVPGIDRYRLRARIAVALAMALTAVGLALAVGSAPADAHAGHGHVDEVEQPSIERRPSQP